MLDIIATIPVVLLFLCAMMMIFWSLSTCDENDEYNRWD